MSGSRVQNVIHIRNSLVICVIDCGNTESGVLHVGTVTNNFKIFCLSFVIVFFRYLAMETHYSFRKKHNCFGKGHNGCEHTQIPQWNPHSPKRLPRVLLDNLAALTHHAA